MAIGATAAITSAVIGSMVYTLPPACQTVVVDGIGYQAIAEARGISRGICGTCVQYVVVAPMR